MQEGLNEFPCEPSSLRTRPVSDGPGYLLIQACKKWFLQVSVRDGAAMIGPRFHHPTGKRLTHGRRTRQGKVNSLYVLTQPLGAGRGHAGYPSGGLRADPR